MPPVLLGQSSGSGVHLAGEGMGGHRRTEARRNVFLYREQRKTRSTGHSVFGKHMGQWGEFPIIKEAQG